MDRKERVDSAESFKDSSVSIESARDSNIMDCHANPCGLSRNDDSLTPSLRGDLSPKQTTVKNNPHEVRTNLAPLRGAKKSDSINENISAESRQSETAESHKDSIELSNFVDSSDSIKSNHNIDCHDSATQNLAMTTKDNSIDSSDSIESAKDSKVMDCHESQSDSRNDGAGSIPRNAESHNDEDSTKEPRFRSIIVGANGLSLGISIVVAILLGIGAGILMQKIFGVFWVLFLGVLWGVLAAILNVYKVYKAELRDFDKLAENPKYAKRQD